MSLNFPIIGTMLALRGGIAYGIYAGVAALFPPAALVTAIVVGVIGLSSVAMTMSLDRDEADIDYESADMYTPRKVNPLVKLERFIGGKIGDGLEAVGDWFYNVSENRKQRKQEKRKAKEASKALEVSPIEVQEKLKKNINEPLKLKQVEKIESESKSQNNNQTLDK